MIISCFPLVPAQALFSALSVALTIMMFANHAEAGMRNLTDVRIYSNVTADLGDGWKNYGLYLIDCKKHGRRSSSHLPKSATLRQRKRHGNCSQEVRCAEFVPAVVTFPRLHYELTPHNRTPHFEDCNCLDIKYPFSYLKKVDEHWEMQFKAVLVGQRCNRKESCRRYEC